MAAADLTQELEPPLRAGEDGAFTFTGSFATDPAGWAVRFTLAAAAGATPAVTRSTADGGVTVSATGSGPYAAAFAVLVPAADSAGLAAGVYQFELSRTDAGSREALAAGRLAVVPAATAYP